MSDYTDLMQGLPKGVPDLMERAARKPSPDILEGWSLPTPSMNYVVTERPDIGLIRGRIYMVYGPDGGGKSTFAGQCCTNVQKAGDRAVYLDMEHSCDEQHCADLGMVIDLNEPNRIPIKQPRWSEETLAIMPGLIKNGADLLVVDSLSKMWPKKMVRAEKGSAEYAARAVQCTYLLRDINDLMTEFNPAVILINQVREAVNEDYAIEKIPCGRDPRHAADVILRLYPNAGKDDKIKGSRGGLNRLSSAVRGSYVTMMCRKNKIGPPHQQCKTPIYYGPALYGFDYLHDAYLFAARNGLISRSSKKGVAGFKVDGEWVPHDPEFEGREDMMKLLPRVMELLKEAAESDDTNLVGEDDDPEEGDEQDEDDQS